MPIPKIFHHIWLGSPFPPYLQKYRDTWKKLHPDYEFKLWTDVDVPVLLNDHQLSHYNKARNFAQKSDIVRYVILARCGGIYVDTDFECYKNVSELLEGYEFVGAGEKPGMSSAGFIACSPAHPVTLAACNVVTHRSTWVGPQATNTGPGLVNYALDIAGQGREDIKIYGPELFYPYGWQEPHRRFESFPNAYAAHHWAHTWKSPETATVDIICLASRPSVDIALRQITNLVRPFKILVGKSPTLPGSYLDPFGNKVVRLEGTDVPNKAGEVRFKLMDTATSDWIVNVDDDDEWLDFPDLRSIPSDVGLITGGAVFMRHYLSADDPKHILIKKPRPITQPSEACNNGGSFWIVRRRAWDSISKEMDRSWHYSDWRMVYRLVEAGWKVHTVQKTLGLVRSYEEKYTDAQPWLEYCKELAKSSPVVTS